MGKIKQTKISSFNGGILQDKRLQSFSKYGFASHFEVLSFSQNLVPKRSFEADETKSFDIVQFVQTNSQIYGLGVVSGTQRAKIFERTGDLVTGSWTESSSGESATGAREESVFFHYKNYLYGFRSGTHLWRWGDITGTPSFTNSYQAITYTDVAPPVHHPADDNAYFFADNIVYRLDNTTWDGAVLTLPDNVKITTATPYGNYLAIGCTSVDPTGGSTVFLWDRDSSLETVSHKIEWGEGSLGVLGVIEGVLFGVSEFGGGGSSGVFGINPKLRIKYLSGTKSTLLEEIDISSYATEDSDMQLVSGLTVTNDDKLFFALQSGGNANAQRYTGIWVVGRSNANSPFAVAMPYKVDTDGSSDFIQGFNIFGDYVWVAHSSDGSVDRTNDQETYSQTSIYESAILSGGDPSVTKKLLGVTVTTRPLPDNAQVTLEYRVDDAIEDGGAWTSLGTFTTNNGIRHSAIRESDGSNLSEFKELQIRIESDGGAVITGFMFQHEEKEDDIYG